MCWGFFFLGFLLSFRTLGKENTCFCVNCIIFEKHSSGSMTMIIIKYGPVQWCSRSGRDTSIPSEALYLNIHSACTVYSLKEKSKWRFVWSHSFNLLSTALHIDMCVIRDGFAFLINHKFYKITVTILLFNDMCFNNSQILFRVRPIKIVAIKMLARRNF